MLFSWGAGASFGCTKKGDDAGPAAGAEGGAKGGEVEDLTIVVEADKSRILQEDAALQAKRKDFEGEKARLDRERAEIADKLANLSKKDKSQRDKLEQEQQRLADEQKRVRERADSFEAARSKLEQEKNNLLERISKMTQTKGGLTIEQREEAIGRRERDVAQRERDVAKREAEAGRGLADVGKMLDEVRSGIAAAKSSAASQAASAQAAATSNTAAASGGVISGPVNKASIQRAQGKVHAAMQSKGILNEDLPPAAKDLDGTVTSSTNSRDFASAADALTQLNQAVDAIAVNHAFVQAKMARINRQFDDKRGSNLDEAKQKRVQGLLAEASDSFSDGRYDRANKKINQIYAILQGS